MNRMGSHEARDGHALLHERIEAPLKAEIERLKNENARLKATLRQHILTYRVDDQAWDREAEADRLLGEVLSDE